MIYGPIHEDREGHQIKGQVYKKLHKTVGSDKTRSNDDSDDHVILGTTSTGKGGVLDSVAQRHIEDLNLEKEKAIVESNNILQEYLMYLKGELTRAHTQHGDESKSQLEKRMIDDMKKLGELGIESSKIPSLVMNEYYGLKNLGIDFFNLDHNNPPSQEEFNKAVEIIRTILKLRINYVNKVTSLMARMLKSNYNMLGLSEEQAKIYIDSLKLGTNDSVKTAGEIKELIKKNSDKFMVNNGEAIDLRSLGFGVILGPSGEEKLEFRGTDGTNKDGMLQSLQAAMRYDVVVVAHGGNRAKINTDKLKNIEKEIPRKLELISDEYNENTEEILDNINDDREYKSCWNFVNSCLEKFDEEVKNNRSVNDFFIQYKSEINKSLDEGNIQKTSDLINTYATEFISSKNYIQNAINSTLKKREQRIKELQNEGKTEDDLKPYITSLEAIKNNKEIVKKAVEAYCFANFIESLSFRVKRNLEDIAYDKNSRYWSCQPTRTLKAGPFEDVNELIRQLIKEGFKKILIEDCNPGGHKLADDIMKTPGILINHSDFSNYVESSIIDSNDENVLAFNEVELSLKEFSESFDIDYNDDEYLEECCQWYLENIEAINEGEFIENLKEFFKKILAGIIGFFKKIFEFAKAAFYKLKTLFNGTKEVPKNTKTNFQKPITTPLIDIESKKAIKIQCANREELEKEASKMCVKFSNIIKAFNKKHQEAMKRINQDIEQLEKQAQNESYGGIDIMSKFLLEDMDLFDVFDDNYLLEFDAEGAPKDEDDEGEEFSMDDEGGGDDTPAPTAEDEGEPAPASEEPPAEDGPPADDNEGEEFSMDEDPPEEGPEDEGEDNYEIPDDDEGGEGQEGEGDDAPPAEDGPPADDGEDEFSMDGDSGEGGGDTEGGEGQPPADDAPTDDTSGEEGEDSETNTKLKELEEVIFDDLSEDEKKMKITELKALYITVYKKCGTISEMLSGIKKDEETIQIIEYISNTLIDLKDYVNDYINKVFDSKTYIENLSQLQKYIAIFNAIHKVFEQIKAENEE